jgi:DnaJ family protein A protein 5
MNRFQGLLYYFNLRLCSAVRRLMEEENKKLRRAETREFNDAVRQLFQFVRKRDMRYIKHQAEQAKLEIQRTKMAERKRVAAKKARAEAAQSYEAGGVLRVRAST